MKLPTDLDSKPARRRAAGKAIALVLAWLTLVICMVGPLLLYGFALQLSWDDELPENAGWLLALGGGVGAGAAYTVSRFVLRRAGFEYHEIDAMWRR